MNKSIVLVLCCFTYMAWANPVIDARQSKPSSRDQLENCLSDWQKKFVNQCVTRVESQIATIKATRIEDEDDNSSSNSEDDTSDYDYSDEGSSEEKEVEMFMIMECFLTLTGVSDNTTHQINETKLQNAVVEMSLLSATDKVKAEASLKSCMNTPSKTPLIEYAALERAMFCSHDTLLKNGCANV